MVGFISKHLSAALGFLKRINSVPTDVSDARLLFPKGGRCHGCAELTPDGETECSKCWSSRHV